MVYDKKNCILDKTTKLRSVTYFKVVVSDSRIVISYFVHKSRTTTFTANWAKNN